MSDKFCVYSSCRAVGSEPRSNLYQYLQSLHRRFGNAIHAETHIYTCQERFENRETIFRYNLRWNETIPDETQLGCLSWGVDLESVEKIEAEFSKGRSVRLLTFDSDSDLLFEEVLFPLKSSDLPASDSST